MICADTLTALTDRDPSTWNPPFIDLFFDLIALADQASATTMRVAGALSGNGSPFEVLAVKFACWRTLDCNHVAD